MGITYFTKNFNANSISIGASASTLFGPIGINHYDELSIQIRNCSSIPIRIQLKGSSDQGLNYAANIPVLKLANSDLSVKPNDTHLNSIIGQNSYNFLTVLASATAAISASDVSMMITAKRRT